MDGLTSIYHVDQLSGLDHVLGQTGSMSLDQVQEAMPNIVRHVERSGYPAVVGKAVEVLRKLLARPDAVAVEDEFEKWNGIPRVVATMSHSNVDVRVAVTVFLAQLGKNSRWNDSIALNKGYRQLVLMLLATEEREQLAALVALRVLLQQSDTHISDFARASGFPNLFKLVRGEHPTSAKVLGQALELLRVSASNRTVTIEIKAAKFEAQVLQLLARPDVAVQSKALGAFEAMMAEDAALQLVKKNNEALPMLVAYEAMCEDSANRTASQSLIAKLK